MVLVVLLVVLGCSWWW
ncbi:hypothetical protein [Streptomyces sp. NPDC096153]